MEELLLSRCFVCGNSAEPLFYSCRKCEELRCARCLLVGGGSGDAPTSEIDVVSGGAAEITRFTKFKNAFQAEQPNIKTARERFAQLFPKERYAYKVMGYNRFSGQQKLELEPTAAVGVTRLFPMQRLVRDYYGPWLTGQTDNPLGHGLIYDAPTGAGKTAALHAMAGNFRGELVNVRTPQRFWWKHGEAGANLDPKKFGAINLKNDMWSQRIVIYVTKANLVPDARKDFWAQNDRSKEAYLRVMRDNRTRTDPAAISPFNPQVNIMSFKQFENLLRGLNPAGRKFWLGLDSIDPKTPHPKLKEFPGIKGRQPVPTAYWRNGGKWQRGNAPWNLASMLGGKDTPTFRVSIAMLVDRVPPTFASELAALLLPFVKEIAGKEELGFPFWVTIKREKNITRTSVFTVELAPGRADFSLDPEQFEQLIEQNPEFEAQVRRLFRDTFKVRRLNQISLKVYRPLADTGDGSGWRLEQTDDGKQWFWAAKGEWDFNPVDRLAVFIDEAHMLFEEGALLHQEAADPALILQALRDSKLGRIVFASATISVSHGLRMLSVINKNVKFSEIESKEEEEEEEPWDDESIVTLIEKKAEIFRSQALGFLFSVDVEGMRDIFPEKVFEPPIEYQLSVEHSETVLLKVEVSVPALAAAINVQLTEGLPAAFDIGHPNFDPDALLHAVFASPEKSCLPLASELLRTLRERIRPEQLAEANRGIVTSVQKDDGIRLVAGLLQAIGFQWLYLVAKPERTAEEKEVFKRRQKRGEVIPLSDRLVEWGPSALNSCASVQTLERYGIKLEEARTKFVVLCNSLLVRGGGNDAESLLGERDVEVWKRYASEHNYKLPFHLFGLRKLKSAGVAESERRKIKESHSPVLRFYPGGAVLPGLKQEVRDALTELQGEPTLYIEKKEAPYVIAFKPFSTLRETFSRISEIAFPSNSLNEKMMIDAKDLILTRFNQHIDSARREKLHYILLGKAFGQGFDVRNVRWVVNLEPAAQPSTQQQRRGRFARPNSHTDLPFADWTVRYYTLVARFAPEVAAEAAEITADSSLRLVNSNSWLSAIETDPLEPLPAQRQPQYYLEPYQLVRLETESPELTLRKLRLEKEFKAWAIDSTHNVILRDAPGAPVYSPTNYVLESRRLVNKLDTKAEEAALDEQQLELGQMTDKLFRLSSEREFGQEFFSLSHRLAQLSDQFDRDRARLGQQQSVINETLSNGERLLPIERHLRAPPATQELVVVIGEKTFTLTAEMFNLPAQERPLSLHTLTQSGIAVFDPQFREGDSSVSAAAKRKSDTAEEEERQEKRTKEGESAALEKRRLEKEEKKQKKKQKKEKEKKKQKKEEKKRKKEKEKEKKKKKKKAKHDPESITSDYWNAALRIGAKKQRLTEQEDPAFRSFGTVMENIAPPDVEQDVIELAAIERFKVAWATLINAQPEPQQSNSPFARTLAQRYVYSLYERMTGGSSEINAIAVKNAILILQTYGLLNWNLAVELLSLCASQLVAAELTASDAASRRAGLTKLANAVGQLFALSLATADSNGLFALLRSYATPDRLLEPLFTGVMSAQVTRSLASIAQMFVDVRNWLQLPVNTSESVLQLLGVPVKYPASGNLFDAALNALALGELSLDWDPEQTQIAAERRKKLFSKLQRTQRTQAAYQAVFAQYDERVRPLRKFIQAAGGNPATVTSDTDLGAVLRALGDGSALWTAFPAAESREQFIQDAVATAPSALEWRAQIQKFEQARESQRYGSVFTENGKPPRRIYISRTDNHFETESGEQRFTPTELAERWLANHSFLTFKAPAYNEAEIEVLRVVFERLTASAAFRQELLNYYNSEESRGNLPLGPGLLAVLPRLSEMGFTLQQVLQLRQSLSLAKFPQTLDALQKLEIDQSREWLLRNAATFAVVKAQLPQALATLFAQNGEGMGRASREIPFFLNTEAAENLPLHYFDRLLAAKVKPSEQELRKAINAHRLTLVKKAQAAAAAAASEENVAPAQDVESPPLPSQPPPIQPPPDVFAIESSDDEEEDEPAVKVNTPPSQVPPKPLPAIQPPPAVFDIESSDDDDKPPPFVIDLSSSDDDDFQ